MDEEAWVSSLHGVDYTLVSLFIVHIVPPCRQTDGHGMRREVGYRVPQRRRDERGCDGHAGRTWPWMDVPLMPMVMMVMESKKARWSSILLDFLDHLQYKV